MIGAVADYGAANLGADVTAFSPTPASSTFTRDLNSPTSLRAQGGWAGKAGLLYATAGMAWGDMEQSFTTTNTLNTFTPSEDSEIHGYQIGLEYIGTERADGAYPVAVGTGTAPSTTPFHMIDPTGTDMKCAMDVYAFSTVGLILNSRQ